MDGKSLEREVVEMDATSSNLQEVVGVMDRRLEALAAEVEALKAQRDALRSEAAALRALGDGHHASVPGSGWRSLMSRRHFLKLAPLAGALAAGAGLLYRAPARADAPNLINYQGRLTDASGNALTGSYSMVFKLYSVPTGGTALWTESWSGANAVSVTDGQFNVLLGSLTSLPSPLPSGDLYLGVAVSSDPEMTPRERLVSVPYALQVPDGSISTAKLADGAVTSRKLQRTRYSAVLSENVTMNNDTWYDLLTQTFTLDVTSIVTIFGQAQLQVNAGDSSAVVRIVVDGSPTKSSDGFLKQGIGTAKFLAATEQLAAGSHTVKLQALIRTYSGGGAASSNTYLDILVG